MPDRYRTPEQRAWVYLASSITGGLLIAAVTLLAVGCRDCRLSDVSLVVRSQAEQLR